MSVGCLRHSAKLNDASSGRSGPATDVGPAIWSGELEINGGGEREDERRAIDRDATDATREETDKQ